MEVPQHHLERRSCAGTQHGISSPQPVVPGLEKQEEWENHRDGIMENLSPVGHLEVTLAERVALLSWRLHRVTRYETETITISQEQVEDDIRKMRRILRLPEKTHTLLHTPRTSASRPNITGEFTAPSAAFPLSKVVRR